MSLMREPGTYLRSCRHAAVLGWVSTWKKTLPFLRTWLSPLKEAAAWLKLHALYATQISSILALDGVYSVENAREFRPLEVGLL